MKKTEKISKGGRRGTIFLKKSVQLYVKDSGEGSEKSKSAAFDDMNRE